MSTDTLNGTTSLQMTTADTIIPDPDISFISIDVIEKTIMIGADRGLLILSSQADSTRRLVIDVFQPDLTLIQEEDKTSL